MTASAKKLTGRHIAMIIGGAFAVVLTMNITFITLALSSFTGEDVPDAFSRGVAYNEILSDRAAQRDLGWTVSSETRAVSERTIAIQLTLLDRDGSAVSGASMAGLVRRPTNEGVDQEISLSEISAGIYETQVAVPLSGVWDLRIEASRAPEERLEFEERIWVE